MDDALRLLCLSIAMLVGCYFFGSIPLAVTMSEKRLRMVSVLGAGLLVGTALAVIIPEGVHALYNVQHDHSHHHDHGHSSHSNTENGLTTASVAQQSIVGLDHDHAEHMHMHAVEPEMFIGLSLCCGFVFMLLIDRISGGHSHASSATDVENNSRQRNTKLTATIGLVVHAAADGVALGAAASTSKTEVEIIIFIAIMLHKAPAAFGLSTFLLLEGFDRNRIRKHLMVFASAAPVLALLTFFGLSQSSKEIFTSVNGTGIAMLFSAGTFLYVATVHVLPEATGKDCGDSDHGRSRVDLILLILGIIAPLLLSVTHSH